MRSKKILSVAIVQSRKYLKETTSAYSALFKLEGAPRSIIQRVAGHTSDIMTAKYIHVDDDRMVEEVRRIRAEKMDPQLDPQAEENESSSG